MFLVTDADLLLFTCATKPALINNVGIRNIEAPFTGEYHIQYPMSKMTTEPYPAG